MRSKNKPAQTALEKRWVSKLAEQPCVICGAHGVEIHEFEQGQWFTSVPLCAAHHRGPHGWHGDRLAWKLAKIDKDQAINLAVSRVALELM